MSNIKECTFNSSWDGESELISTSAKINLDTGEVFDIEKVSEEVTADFETLDREFIDFDGINAEFEVSGNSDNAFFVDDLDAVKEALEAAAPKP